MGVWILFSSGTSPSPNIYTTAWHALRYGEKSGREWHRLIKLSKVEASIAQKGLFHGRVLLSARGSRVKTFSRFYLNKKKAHKYKFCALHCSLLSVSQRDALFLRRSPSRSATFRFPRRTFATRIFSEPVLGFACTARKINMPRGRDGTRPGCMAKTEKRNSCQEANPACVNTLRLQNGLF